MVTAGLEIEDEELLQQAAAWREYPGVDDLSDDVLREIAATKGIDFATALLYCRICSSHKYGSFIDLMKQGRMTPNVAQAPSPQGTTIGIVPAIYDNKRREHESSGDFLADHVRQLGYQAVIIPVPPVRTVEDGAAIIREWVRCQRERTILMSLSIGSVETKLALQHRRPEEEFDCLEAWVNITGPLTGSPLINLIQRKRFWWSLLRGLLWLRGRKLSLLTDLRYGPDTALWEPLRAPANLPIYHLMGFPLPRHYPAAVTCSAEKYWWKMVQWLQLSKYGPNEGVGVLGSLLREPGLIYPVWGVPHWLGPRWNILPLVTRVLEHIESNGSPRRRGVESP